MKVIKPPTPFEKKDLGVFSFFLAGSIELGKAVDWQVKVEKALEPYLGTILNPRRDDWDSSWEQSIDNPEFAGQVRWERKGLKECDVILMYFDPDTQSPITLQEFGKYETSGKLIVACPKGFWRRGNLEVACKDEGIPLLESLDELIDAAKKKIEALE